MIFPFFEIGVVKMSPSLIDPRVRDIFFELSSKEVVLAREVVELGYILSRSMSEESEPLEEELRKLNLLVSSQQEIDAWWTRRQFLQFMNPIIPLVLS